MSPAYGNFTGEDKGYDADVALLKFRAVKAGTGAESVTVITAVTDPVIGVAQVAVSAAELLRGKGVNVREEGITEWEAGAAVARDDFLTIDNVGRCVTAGAGANIWGQARQAASAAGKRIAVSITKVPTP